MPPDSNVTLRRELHEEKQQLPRNVTVDGMQIDVSNTHSAKADLEMRKSSDSGSNVTDDINS
jgi:hypothetical protein